jgi:hypothetical protein
MAQRGSAASSGGGISNGESKKKQWHNGMAKSGGENGIITA